MNYSDRIEPSQSFSPNRNIQENFASKGRALAKEHESVSLLRLLKCIVDAFTFIASSSTLIWVYPFFRDRSQLIFAGDDFYRSGGQALFLMGLAFFMLGGLHLIKQCINQIHGYYIFRQEKTNIENEALNRLAAISHHLLFVIGCFSLTIACWRESDLLRKAVGQSAFFPRLDVDCITNRHTSVYFVSASMILFFAYILFKEIDYYFTKLENNRKNKLLRIYNSRLYRMFCCTCALLGFLSLAVDLSLYFKNEDFFDSHIDHMMMCLLCFSLLMFFVYNVLNIPRIVHTYCHDKGKASTFSNHSRKRLVKLCCLTSSPP